MNPEQLTTAFAVWAAVVGMIGVAIVYELSRLRTEVRTMSNQLSHHMLDTEHRVTAIETHLVSKSDFTPRRVVP